MTAKQEVRSLLEKLPDNCSIEDIQYHLYVLEKVRSGLEDASGYGIPLARDFRKVTRFQLPLLPLRFSPRVLNSGAA